MTAVAAAAVDLCVILENVENQISVRNGSAVACMHLSHLSATVLNVRERERMNRASTNKLHILFFRECAWRCIERRLVTSSSQKNRIEKGMTTTHNSTQWLGFYFTLSLSHTHACDRLWRFFFIIMHWHCRLIQQPKCVVLNVERSNIIDNNLLNQSTNISMPLDQRESDDGRPKTVIYGYYSCTLCDLNWWCTMQSAMRYLEIE